MGSLIGDEIEIAIRNAIREGVDTSRREGLDTPGWTAAIMFEVLKAGNRLKYSVWVRRCSDEMTSEWLWDMTWLHFAGGDNLLGIPLALESEWNLNLNEILWDFRKLLVSRADLRVMIFQASVHTASDRLDRLVQEIRQYSGTRQGDRYLLVCWCYGQDSGRLEFRNYVAD